MTSSGARSVRTCIGCRERSAPADLLRVVLCGGEAIPDPRGALPGRGAWLHPACLEIAERRKAFTRALRTSQAPSTSALRDYVARMSKSVAMDAGQPELGGLATPQGSTVRDRGIQDAAPMSTQP